MTLGAAAGIKFGQALRGCDPVGCSGNATCDAVKLTERAINSE